jgi:hypothetical protein
MIGRANLSWKGDRLYVGTRLSGYSVVPDEQYPSMWRIRRPDGSSSDMVSRPGAFLARFSIVQIASEHCHGRILRP